MQLEIIDPKESSLRIGRGLFTRTAAILPEDQTLAEWMETGNALNLANESTYFWVGDWLLSAERLQEVNFKIAYQKIMERFSISEDTVRACRWVAQNVPPEIRREELSWNFHQQVASLAAKKDADEPTKAKAHELQAHWLKVAVEEKLTAEQFRIAVRADKSPKSKLLSQVKLSAAATASEDHSDTAITLKGDDRGDVTNLALISETCRSTQRMIDWYKKHVTEDIAPSVRAQLKKDIEPFIEKIGAVIEIYEGML